jgi:hypothetical protein
MPAKLKHGVIGAPGGKRKNSGRKPSEFIAKCHKLSEHPDFFRWADRVFKGEDTEVKIIDGLRVTVPASANEKIYLWEKITAYSKGKPNQTIEHSGEIGIAGLIASSAEDVPENAQ